MVILSLCGKSTKILKEDRLLNHTMKDVIWVGDSPEKVRNFPKAVRRTVGEALRFAQRGGKHPKAKPLQGIDSGVLEIVARFDTNTYRAVYTVKIGEKIYVLHAFQKKSARRISTPKREINLIKQRLRRAREMEMENE